MTWERNSKKTSLKLAPRIREKVLICHDDNHKHFLACSRTSHTQHRHKVTSHSQVTYKIAYFTSLTSYLPLCSPILKSNIYYIIIKDDERWWVWCSGRDERWLFNSEEVGVSDTYGGGSSSATKEEAIFIWKKEKSGSQKWILLSTWRWSWETLLSFESN